MEPIRTRREPPAFHRAAVVDRHDLGGRLAAVDLRFGDLGWLDGVEPAASVRLLLPSAPGQALEIPQWNGNEFLLADGRRPTLRTLTPLTTDGDVLRLAILRHGGSPLSSWLERCGPGDQVAVSGPGRGLTPDPAVGDWILAGDESAIPAIMTLLRAIPPPASIRVIVEADEHDPEDRPAMPDHVGASIDWGTPGPGAPSGDTLVRRLAQVTVSPDTLLWAAGEAAAMQRIRRQLDRGSTPRSMTVVRGYWKVNGASSPAGSNPSTAP